MTEMPKAISRALPLMEGPDEPDVSHGYLDLLGTQTSESSGPVQTLWASKLGSAGYDQAQVWLRRMSSLTRLPDATLRSRPGAHALDVGCGPGEITAQLGRAVGPAGLALGVDVSEPMLDRAVRAQSADHVGFLRADARRLPFPAASFDVVTALAVLQLIPEPFTVLDEMARVLKPGGHLAMMIPTVRGTLFDKLNRLVGGRTGLRFFEPTEVAEHLHAAGLSTIHTRHASLLLWVLADKAEH